MIQSIQLFQITWKMYTRAFEMQLQTVFVIVKYYVEINEKNIFI